MVRSGGRSSKALARAQPRVFSFKRESKMADRILSQSSFSHVIEMAIERGDIADWLFNEAEYQRCCPPDHIAAGAAFTDDGRRMSINVERIGETLMVSAMSARSRSRICAA